MRREDLESQLMELAAELLEKSKSGKVNWQTVGGEPENYHVHFGDQTSFVVCFNDSPYNSAKTASISLNIKSMLAARIHAEEGTDDFETFKRVFDEAHRAATRWDEAMRVLREKVASDEIVGDAPGDIPL